MSLSKFTPMMLAAMEAESRAYPSMKPYFENILSKPNADEIVHVEIRKALINELDSSRYKKTAGRWLLLRKEFRKNMAEQGPVNGLGAAAAGGGSTGAIVGAVSGIATTLIAIAAAKYQRDKMRKAERRAAARERASEAQAVRDAELAHARAMFQARLAARAAGAPVSRGQVNQMAKEEAAEITSNVMQTMARSEVQNQIRLDNQITAKQQVNPIMYAAPAAAVAAMALA